MTSLTDQPVLVTGGGGFLGRAICRAALAAGARVHSLHRRPGFAAPGEGKPGETVHHVQCDLVDEAAVGAVLDRVRPAVILHAAGFASASRDLLNVQPALRDNLLATVSLLTAATNRGIQVVMNGSVEAPDDSREGGAIAPNSPYAASKYAEACYARMFHRNYGLNVVVARLAVVYGPGEARPAKLIPYIVSRLMAGEPAELTSGRRRMDWIYADDAASGVLACATKFELGGGTVDIGTGRLTSIADVAVELARIMGRPELVRLGVRPDRPNESEHAANVAATEAKIGWRAAVTLEEGLRRTVEWFGGTFAATDAKFERPVSPSLPRPPEDCDEPLART